MQDSCWGDSEGGSRWRSAQSEYRLEIGPDQVVFEVTLELYGISPLGRSYSDVRATAELNSIRF